VSWFLLSSFFPSDLKIFPILPKNHVSFLESMPWVSHNVLDSAFCVSWTFIVSSQAAFFFELENEKHEVILSLNQNRPKTSEGGRRRRNINLQNGTID